jgi:aspartyl-tRNA synthetase
LTAKCPSWSRDDILTVTEGFIRQLWKEVLGMEIEAPFMRMSYHDAMSRYGSDKPDLRFGMEIKHLNEAVASSEFKVFKEVIGNGGIVAGINAKGCADYSRKQIDGLTDFAKNMARKAWHG